jgi:hypothetical protein|tara:strand:+ start:28 stop:216 length:189 start_codon:yes stop_codon:yes gene_type:complete
MKIGDLVLDKTIDQMGIVTNVNYIVDHSEGRKEEYIIVELCDGTEVLASEEDLKLILSSRLS